MHKVKCGKCDKEYLKNDEVAVGCNDICYDCALKGFIGNGGPEESDINTALLQSGEISDADLICLQRDLEAVDYAARACSDCGQIRCCCDPSEQIDEDEY